MTYTLLCLLNLAIASVSDEPRWQTGLSGSELGSLLESLPARNEVPSNLRCRLTGGKLEFDIQVSPNPADTPWVALINLDSVAYRKANQENETAGYKLSVHTTVRANRKLYHSAVWVRESRDPALLDIPAGPLPEQGDTCPEFAPLDDMMRSFLADHHLPGATLAVAKDGRLLYSRGFGYADLESRRPMAPDARMRIASVSKPITAVAVLQLVEAGKLRLEDSVLEILTADGNPDAYPAPTDERWHDITIRLLLQHRAGWDRDVTSDPMFQGANIGRALALEQPPAPVDIIRYQLTQPLDFEPGARYAYCNFGYCLLGQVIQRVSGQDYNSFVEDSVLQPAGMQQTFPGRTRPQFRRPGEVTYYTQTLEEFPAYWMAPQRDRGSELLEFVQAPYGQWDLELMDSHGGWVSTAPDLLRFVRQLEHPKDSLLNRVTLEQMVASPDPDHPARVTMWYGFGWNVRPWIPGELPTFWHNGSLAGTSALLVHRHDGWSWAVLINCDTCLNEQLCAVSIDPHIHIAVNRIDEVPEHDLFESP